MSGQSVDATIVAAPKQRNASVEKKAIKEGCIPEDWKENPAKLAQKDREARWMIKHNKAKPSEDEALRVDLAIPAFGYKSHVSIDRAHGLIRNWTTTHAAAHDGALSDRGAVFDRIAGGSRPARPSALVTAGQIAPEVLALVGGAIDEGVEMASNPKARRPRSLPALSHPAICSGVHPSARRSRTKVLDF